VESWGWGRSLTHNGAWGEQGHSSGSDVAGVGVLSWSFGSCGSDVAVVNC
jgi:hypothetical protein